MDTQVIYFILGLLGCLNILILSLAAYYVKGLDNEIKSQSNMFVRLLSKSEGYEKDGKRIEREVERLDKTIGLTDAELARQKFKIHTIEGTVANLVGAIRDIDTEIKRIMNYDK